MKWCSDIEKFKSLITDVEIAYEIHTHAANWDKKYYKTPEECLELLKEAENLITLYDNYYKLSFNAIFLLRKFYELKGKILILLNKPYEAYSALKDALYICRKDVLENRLSILFWSIVGVLIIWYSILLPVLKKIF